MNNIKTCSFCGRLFNSLGSNICAECCIKLDKDFIKVREYLSKNKSTGDAAEIVQNTGVSEKAVLYFIKEGRLSSVAPSDGGTLKCQVCGAAISTGRMCHKCMASWNSDVASKTEKSGAAQGAKNELPKKNVIRMHTDHN